MVERRRWQSEADRLGNADPSDPTGWFERLWSAAGRGDVAVPWDRDDPHPVLASWLGSRGPAAGRTAVVVGCGLGADAEHLSRLGWATTAFDVSPSAVAAARERHPGSAVRYAVADLLDLPPGWAGAFDLVVEIYTVQAVHRSVRGRLTAGVRSLVAPGGTLLVVQAVAHPGDDDGPPWLLTRSEIEAFGEDGLSVVSIEQLAVEDPPGRHGLWRAELHRD
jgi:SAM-dependent methyltransferase